MGDFNDEPFDTSLVTQALSTRQRRKVPNADNPLLWNLDGRSWEAGRSLGDAEPDHLEGVEDGDRVAAQATERSQRTVQVAVREPLRLVVQPPLVGGSRPANSGVEQPPMQASVVVKGEMEHDGHGPNRLRSATVARCAQSTPRVVTFCNRSGLPTRALASTSIASQQVCQSTPR